MPPTIKRPMRTNITGKPIPKPMAFELPLDVV